MLTSMLGLGLGLGCSGSSADIMNSTTGDPVEVPPWACVPGESQPCPCADGLEGLLTCNPEGSGFGECDCSPGAVSQGPPPTSSGTEGSGSGTEGDTGSGSGGSAGSTTVDPTTVGSTGTPDPTTSGGSSSGEPDPTTSGGSSSGTT
ncbi:hypothetical protein OEB96_08535 [Paraliomyxa miuraensis]|nr:hypothetical protein [Paraliomyxa miuraensis]